MTAVNEILSSTIDYKGTGMTNAFGWFDISDLDRDRVSALQPVVEAQIDDILDDFYDRSGGFDHPTRHMSDTGQMQAIRQEQRRHFLELFDSGLSEEYYATRAQAGIFNERTGVSPSFYIGTYSYFLKRLAGHVREKVDDPAEAFETILSLQKVAACHKALTLEAYSRARDEAIEARDREISELPVPVLRMREGLLLVPVVGTLDSHRARMLTTRMLDTIRDQGARAIVLDITGVAAVDSAVANHLMQTMAAARLMGAQSVLTGITADVAQSLVKVGVTGEALNPAGDLQRGIETAERLLAL